MFPVIYNESSVLGEPWIREFLPGGSQWEEPEILRKRNMLNWWLDSVGYSNERFVYAEHGGFWHVWVYPTFQPHLAQPRHVPKSFGGQRIELNEWVIETYILPESPLARLSPVERREKMKEWNTAYEKVNAAQEEEAKGVIKERLGQEFTAHPGSAIAKEHLALRGELVVVTQPGGIIDDRPAATPAAAPEAEAVAPPALPAEPDLSQEVGGEFIPQEFVEDDIPAIPAAALETAAAGPPAEAAAQHTSGRKKGR